jgi:hypothetical protein
MTVGTTQPLTEMSTRNCPEGKGRPALKADNLTAICEPVFYSKCGRLYVSQTYRPIRPVTEIILLILPSYAIWRREFCAKVLLFRVLTKLNMQQPVSEYSQRCIYHCQHIYIVHSISVAMFVFYVCINLQIPSSDI